MSKIFNYISDPRLQMGCFLCTQSAQGQLYELTSEQREIIACELLFIKQVKFYLRYKLKLDSDRILNKTTKNLRILKSREALEIAKAHLHDAIIKYCEFSGDSNKVDTRYHDVVAQAFSHVKKDNKSIKCTKPEKYIPEYLVANLEAEFANEE